MVDTPGKGLKSALSNPIVLESKRFLLASTYSSLRAGGVQWRKWSLNDALWLGTQSAIGTESWWAPPAFRDTAWVVGMAAAEWLFSAPPLS